MSLELVAILDAPKSAGMGMHGVLLRDSRGLVTSGLRRNRRVSDREYAELVEGGHVLGVTGELPLPLLGNDPTGAVALWVGDQFTDEAERLGVPAPAPPVEGSVMAPSGRFWFDLPSAVYVTTQSWLKKGLRHVVADPLPELAHLMVAADATSDLTRAALLHISDDADRDLRWFLRLDKDAGLAASAVTLTRDLDALRQTASGANGRVIALVAHFSCGSHELGRELATSLGVEFSAFRDYFRQEALRLFDDDDRRALVSAGEIVTAYRSPDAIAEAAVLAALRPSAGGVLPAVVDGLRHHHILDSIRRAVDVDIAAVTSPRRPGVTGLDESMPPAEIARSNTESEVDSLASEATFRLPKDRRKVKLALAAT